MHVLAQRIFILMGKYSTREFSIGPELLLQPLVNLLYIALNKFLKFTSVILRHIQFVAVITKYQYL